MRRIIFFIIGILLLLLFFTAFTLFLPSKVTVAKSIRINASSPEILSQTNNFNNWKTWYPVFRDSNVIVTITGSNNRSAELVDKYGRKMVFRILAVSNNEVDVELYVKEKSVTTYKIMLQSPGTTSTDVTWIAITNLGWYPWKKLQGLILDKATGEQYAYALAGLKAVVESQADSVSPE